MSMPPSRRPPSRASALCVIAVIGMGVLPPAIRDSELVEAPTSYPLTHSCAPRPELLPAMSENLLPRVVEDHADGEVGDPVQLLVDVDVPEVPHRLVRHLGEDVDIADRVAEGQVAVEPAEVGV